MTARSIPFRATARSEAAKLATAPAQAGTLAAAGVATVLVAVFVGLSGSLQPDDTRLGGALTGAMLGQLLAGVLGALVMTSEHASGLAATTFVATPRRARVVGAKALVVAGATAVVGTVASVVSVVVASPLIGSGHPPGDPFPAVLGVGLGFGLVAVLGLALGALLRHTAGAVAAVAGLVLLPQLLGELAGDLQPWVMGLSPATALQKMTQSSDAATAVAGSLGPWPSLGALAAVAVALLLAATAAVLRRDV